MCGISGIYNLNGSPIQREEILAQIETLIHRGPDQGAAFISARGRCGLGVRRLSIIDLAGGHQPLANEDGTLHLVYNGETYNHLDLRAELVKLGHHPQTGNDGEVILHGYAAWGVDDMLNRLRGMGAFALWDETRGQLLLARDRFGIKPLYYARHGGRLYFASEIKAILTQPDFPRRVNLPALQAMLTIGFVPGVETMFEGLYRLPPAHYLIVGGPGLQIKPYWRLSYSPENYHLSRAEAAEQFLALLQEAVKLRLMSEVPLGALLSGGLDSGAIVALIQAGLNRKLKTVSIGFQDAAYDEASLAGELAQLIGTDHHQLTCDDRSFDSYGQIMAHLEEPQSWATSIPIFHLYRACRQTGLTVVLTGEGADELLGGYHWHGGDILVRPLLALPPALRHLLAALPLPMSPPARRVLQGGARNLALRYQHWLEVAGGNYRPSLLSTAAAEALNGHYRGLNPLLADWGAWLSELGTTSPVEQMLWLQVQTRLANYINFQVDRLSMANSVEARVPFLDHKLWEFCATLPTAYKLSPGRPEKSLLRQATRDILPPATRRRRKKGLAAPYARWLQAERLPDWAEAALSQETLARVGLFNPTIVQNLRRPHQATPLDRRGQQNLGPLLMGVLSTQIWYDRFIS
jgi:asparagine synthase (glutamine-hydrolysing)